MWIRRVKVIGTTAALVASLLTAVVLGSPAAHALDVGDITTAIGGGAQTADGIDPLSMRARPADSVIDRYGDVFYFDTDDRVVREVPARSGVFFGLTMTAGRIYRVAGILGLGGYNASGVDARSQSLSEPVDSGMSITVDHDGNLFILQGTTKSGQDVSFSWVQEVAVQDGTDFGIAMTAGKIYTVAGQGSAGQPVSGSVATATSFGGRESGMAVDAAGNLLIADSADNEVLALAAGDGTFYGVAMLANHLYVIAGDGTAKYNDDGAAPRGPTLLVPHYIAVTPAGDLVIGEFERVIELPAATGKHFGIQMTGGKLYTLMGAGTGKPGVDPIPATSAASGAAHIAVDAGGNLVFTDWGENDGMVFELAATSHTALGVPMTAGSIYRIAGNGTAGFAGDGGPALDAEFDTGYYVAVDPAGDVWVSDQNNRRVREILSGASTAVIISGTVTAAQTGGTIAGVAGVYVQACGTDGEGCSAATSETAANGAYSITAPGPGTYVVTAYPPGQAQQLHLQAATSAPLVVGADGRSGVALRMTAEQPIPAGLTVGGQSGVVARVSWSSPTAVSADGCAGGLGFVVVTGTDMFSGDPSLGYANLIETPVGSGHYEGTVPPLAPMHGNIDIAYQIDCSAHSALVPASGPTTGGTTVDIRGTGFTGATAVRFGSRAAASFSVLSDSELSAVAPAGAGSVPVSIVTPAGTIADAADADASFTYVAVTRVSPANAKAGSTVTITGTGFTNANALFMGDVTADDWTIESDNTITATVPAGADLTDVNLDLADGGITPARDASAAARVQPRAASSGGVSAGTAGAWASAAAFVAKHLNVIINTCAGTSDLRDVLKNLAQNELNELRKDPEGIVTGAINNLPIAAGSVALAAGIAAFSSMPFAVALALIAIVVATPDILKAIQAAAVNPNTDKCIKKFLPTPTPPPAKPKCKKGKNCGKNTGGHGSGKLDPSGTIVDSHGNPIAGATATISRSDTPGGTFTDLAADSSLIEPNINPETTAADGGFHWDVASGWYEVTAAKSGCTTASTAPLPVPPPQLGIVITLSCTGEPALPTPTITHLYSASGPTAGGNQVTVIGTGFTATSTVHFGASAGSGVVFVSPTMLRATAPAGTGQVGVTVTNATGTSASSAYDYLAPVVLSSLSPATGSATGGTTVTLAGSGFGTDPTVLFGGQPARSVTVVSDSSLRVVAPAGSTGAAAVRVLTAAGESGASTFTYKPAGSTVTVTASVSAPHGGKPVTFAASVASANKRGTPTGHVAFSANGKPISACKAVVVRATKATCSVAFTGGTTQRVVATYGGDGTFSRSASAAKVEHVQKQLTRIAVKASTLSVKVGARVTFTAAVTPATNGRPTGHVSFWANGRVRSACRSVVLVTTHSGRHVASCEMSFASATTAKITVHYTGDKAYAASVSAVVEETVRKH